LMDFCSPQYYGGPGLATKQFVVTNIRPWIDLLGPDRVGLGFGINAGAPNYMTTAECASTWRSVVADYPNLRGAYLWSLATDEANRWGYGLQVAPFIA
jgi:chitinase